MSFVLGSAVMTAIVSIFRELSEAQPWHCCLVHFLGSS